MNAGSRTGQYIGSYHLLELLGEGAMGETYHAYHIHQRHHAAIKILTLNSGASPSNQMERFILEAQTIANLHHPHIVPMYEYGIDQAVNFIAMPWYQGGTLEDRLTFQRRQALLPSLGEVSQLLSQIADALTYAHDQGVLHRDVKSSNILFDEWGKAYLVDFGIAKLMNVSWVLTATDLIMGTPMYMSPEQWRGETLTPAADQYGLGVVAYEMITGQLPFNGETPHALMYQHLNEIPQPVYHLRPGLPETLDRVLRWALEKDPEDRYPTVKAFAEAFAIAITGMEGTPTDFFTFPLPKEITGSFGNTPPFERIHESSQPAPPVQRKSLPVLFALITAGLLMIACIASLLALATNQPLAAAPASSTPTAIVLAATAFPSATDTPILPSPSPTPDITPHFDLIATLDPADSVVRTIAIHPAGNALVSGGNSDMPQVWDIATGSKGALLQGHTGLIYGLAYSPDGSLIASASEDGTVRLWDSATGQLLNTLYGHAGEVRDVVFHPDGDLLASVGYDQTVRLWDVATGESRGVLAGQYDRILSAVFSPDGARLATGWMDETIAIWDVASQRQQSTLVGHTGEIRSLAFNTDGTLLASSSGDNTIRIWDMTTDSTRFTMSGHESSVYHVNFSPDGSLLASGGADNSVVVWDTATGEMMARLDGHIGWVFDVRFSADNSLLASGAGDGRVHIWRVSRE